MMNQALQTPVYQNLLLEEPESGVFLLTINRPDALNALNVEILVELDNALDQLEESGKTRVLLITGTGNKAFVAGADIKHMSTLTPEQGRRFSALGARVFRRLELVQFPVIGLVNGYALGGGCELAMACDFLLASERAQFGQPEINLGIVPGFGGSQRLPRKVGQSMATEMMMTGQSIKADEAQRLQLVNHVYPTDELIAEGIKLAKTLASKSSEALRSIKQLVQQGQDLNLDSACAMESALFGLVLAGQGSKDGMKAFLTKSK